MSLVSEYEDAKVRTERLQRVSKTVTKSLEGFHSAVQELHDIFVDTFVAGLDVRTDGTTEKWLSDLQVTRAFLATTDTPKA